MTINVKPLLSGDGVCAECWCAYYIHAPRCRFSTDAPCVVCGMLCPGGACHLDDDRHRAARTNPSPITEAA